MDSDAYLLELARYVVLNPVRAGMVQRAQDWPWSSYPASMGLVPAQEFLAIDGLLAQFANRRHTAQARYAQFVAEGMGAVSPWKKLTAQVYLGDDAFVEKMQKRVQKQQREDVQIPLAQRRAPAPSLKAIEQAATDRNAAMVCAYATGAYSYQQIAAHFGVHFTTVGRVVRQGV